MKRPVLVGIAALSVLLGAAPARPQNPAVSSHQGAPAGARTPPDAKPGAQADSQPAGPPVSLQDVAKRISAVLAEQSARTAGQADEKPAATTRAKPAAPRPAPARRASPVVLKWDPALASSGVALAWGAQLDPRRARASDLGVRLVWPDTR